MQADWLKPRTNINYQKNFLKEDAEDKTTLVNVENAFARVKNTRTGFLSRRIRKGVLKILNFEQFLYIVV